MKQQFSIYNQLFSVDANSLFPSCNDYLLFTTIFIIISIFIVAGVIVFLGVFLPHSGKFTIFLHRLCFIYLVYSRWLEGSGIALNYDLSKSNSRLEFIQEDSLYFDFFMLYSTFIVSVFFFGVAEFYFLSKIGRLEFSMLVLFLHFGGIFALRLNTFIDLLISLEIVTLASYVFVTFERHNRFSTYSGVQYFILGSLPSALLLISLAFFYLQGGSTAFQDLDILFNTSFNFSSDFITDFIFFNNSIDIGRVDLNNIIYGRSHKEFSIFSSLKIESLKRNLNPINNLSLLALAFFFFNMFFKRTAAPFHVWAPSVYGKAPLASVTLLSIYSKRLILFILYKLRSSFLHIFSAIIIPLRLRIGVLSILVGRIGAFTEKLSKRFFVFSSIGHVGFILIGLGIITIEGYSASFHYLFVYIVSSFIRWFFLITIGREKTYLSHFIEVKSSNFSLALLFAFLIFSISGIPPFGGFIIKLDILVALLDSSHFLIVYLLFFFTVASFFYYLRVIKIRFFDNNLYSTEAISFSRNFIAEVPVYSGRIWLISVFILILSLYTIVVQKPILRAQYELLSI